MGGEFDFIHNIKTKYGLTKVGDDCAVLPKDAETDLLITADLLVEDVDFRLEWTMPELLGHKALAVSLSDIAAMGGEPESGLLSIGVPEKIWNSGFLPRLYDGWYTLAKRFGVELVGGDVSRTPDRLVIDSIVLGTVEKGSAVFRTGASPGDVIFVTGKLGGAAGGLRLLESGRADASGAESNGLLRRQLKPEPKVLLGRLLREDGLASSMIDISDGLSSDLRHICEASLVGARIDASCIPIEVDLADNFDHRTALKLSLNGGEDFELLFTVPREKLSLLRNGEFSEIGVVTENAGNIELFLDGKLIELPAGGYRHF